MQLLVHPAAAREMAQALKFARQHFGAAVAAKLVQRIHQAGFLLQREPGLGAPANAQARRLPLRGYPYTLVYRVTGQVVHVLAFMHQSRMPDYWVHRD